MESFLDLFNPVWGDDTSINDRNGNICDSDDSGSTQYPLNHSSPSSPSLPDQLPSEPQDGNIEYKLKLLNPNKERLKRLVSQMQWRLREGLGEAIYEIGVSDSGHLHGLSCHEMEASMKTLRRMAGQLGASLTVIREKKLRNDLGQLRRVAEVLVRKVPDDQCSIEIRVAVIGSSGVGKSTMLGVLTRGELDNGRGCARLNVFRHRHEVYTGKTSSISMQIMGFDPNGRVIDQTCTRSHDYNDEDICKKSSKIINFIDLAGDQKYLRTTAFGLSGYSPHYAILTVSAFSGVSFVTREHVSLAEALDVPLIIVVNKTDLATSHQIQSTVSDLRTLIHQLHPGQKRLLVIDNVDEAISAGKSDDDQTVPVFCISSVTGEGLESLKKFLFLLPPKISQNERKVLENDPVEFAIDEVFQVGRSCVLGGLLTKGIMIESTSLLLGPFDDFSFKKVKVNSIYRNKVPCRVVYAGQSASLSFTPYGFGVRKGMKLLQESLLPKACIYFQARLHVIEQNSCICVGSQATLHIGNIRQTAVVEAILGRRSIYSSQTASAILRFVRRPEYVSVGSRFLFRANGVKGTGRVVQVFHEEAAGDSSLTDEPPQVQL